VERFSQDSSLPPSSFATSYFTLTGLFITLPAATGGNSATPSGERTAVANVDAARAMSGLARRLAVVGLCSTMIDLPSRAAAEIVNRLAPGVRIDIDTPPVTPPVAGPMPTSLAGEWSGEVLAHNGSHRFALTIHTSGALSAQLDDRPRASVEVVEWIDSELRGSIVSDIGTEDVRRPYRLRFHLHAPDPDRLEGTISAWSFRAGRGPDILPSFLRLRRAAGSDR
jgi:hypothetical protein